VEESEDSKLCGCCGQLKNTVTVGPKGDLGFYTDDQEGFNLQFFMGDEQYLICSECISEIKTGFNYVSSKLDFWARRPINRDGGIEFYLIPTVIQTTDDSDASIDRLKEVLRVIENARTILADRGIQTEIPGPVLDAAQNAALPAHAKKTSRRPKKTTARRESDPKSVDLLQLFNEIDNTELVSFRLILFNHPPGNASAFHNFYNIAQISSIHINHLKNALHHLTLSSWNNNPFNQVEKFELWKLINAFGKFGFKPFYMALVGGEKVKRTLILQAARINIRRSFFQDAMSLDSTFEDSLYFNQRITILDQYLFLMNQLQLLED
jgi:hypothetical protein